MGLRVPPELIVVAALDDIPARADDPQRHRRPPAQPVAILTRVRLGGKDGTPQTRKPPGRRTAPLTVTPLGRTAGLPPVNWPEEAAEGRRERHRHLARARAGRSGHIADGRAARGARLAVTGRPRRVWRHPAPPEPGRGLTHRRPSTFGHQPGQPWHRCPQRMYVCPNREARSSAPIGAWLGYPGRPHAHRWRG